MTHRYQFGAGRMTAHRWCRQVIEVVIRVKPTPGLGAIEAVAGVGRLGCWCCGVVGDWS